jgi:trk system potassium uptake protein TrkA
MQAVAAMTTSDADNLALCFLVRTRYNVPRTIARINNPRNAWLFDSKFHVDVALNQAQILASLIQEEMSLGDMMTLLKLRRGQFLLVEEKIPPKARVVGSAVRDLVLPEQSVITAILRHGEVVMPRGSTVLEADDELLAVTDARGAEALAKLLAEE